MALVNILRTTKCEAMSWNAILPLQHIKIMAPKASLKLAGFNL